MTQLLETVRIQADRFELDRTNTNVAALVGGIVEHMRLRTGGDRIILHAPADAYAAIDPLRFEQVVTNLLDNAIKFSPDGGHIEAEFPPDGGTRFVVEVPSEAGAAPTVESA